MTFQAELLADAIALCSGEGSEAVTYYPAGDLEDGVERTGIVERELLEPAAVEPGHPVVDLELQLPNDATAGVLASAVQKGKDLVDVADEAGVLHRCTVTTLRSDPGMTLLGLRRGPVVVEGP